MRREPDLETGRPGTALQRLRPRYAAALVALAAIGWAFAYAISDETPVGSVHGRVVMAELRRPLSGAEITLTPIGAHGGHNAERIRYTKSGDDGRFAMARVPAGEYHISADAHAHSASDTYVYVDEGGTTTVDLSMTRSLSEFDLKQHQRVFGTVESAHLALTGYQDESKPTGEDTMHLRLWKTRLSTVLQNSDTSAALEQVGRNTDDSGDSDAPKALPAVLLRPSAGPAPHLFRQQDVPIAGADLEGFFYQKLDFGPLPTGLYLLDVAHRKKVVSAWLLVTDTALIVKRASRQIVAYAVDMQQGTPVSGSAIRAYRNGRIIAHSETDARGIADLMLPAAPAKQVSADGEEVNGGDAGDQTDSTRTMTVAVRGDDEAVVERDDFRDEDQGEFVLHAYTDRPIYRPGQRIYFKGIARRTLEPGTGEEGKGGAGSGAWPRYSVPTGEPVRVEIRDPSGERILEKSCVSNAYGSFNGLVDLDPEARTGVYSLIMTVRGKPHTHDIVVASYKKPEYAVTVTPDKPHYTRGEQVAMSVSAQYYFGAPVAGAKIKYEVYRSPDWAGEYADDADAGDEDESEPSYYHGRFESYYGATVAQGETTLDENGKAVLTFRATPPPDPEAPQSDIYTASVTVTESEGRETEADGTVKVTAGDFRLTAQPDGYVASPGQPTNVNITARDFNGVAVPNLALDLEIGYNDWSRGDYHYQMAGIQHVVTGPDGRVTVVIVPPRAGELEIKARAFDTHRHKILGRGDLWVEGDQGGDLDTEYADLSLLTDKRRYNPGDTARVLVNSARTGQSVLLSVEGERVYATQLVPMNRRSRVVYVPIRPEYGPNVFLSACYVRDKHFARSEAPLRVTIPQQDLKIAIHADREPGTGNTAEGTGKNGKKAPPEATLARYQPGDKITYTVQTTDAQGRPAPCELSFGVVDEAIYALAEDAPNAIRDDFYPRRDNEVDTEYSFAITYLGDADKAEPKITARKKFPDTAFWDPDLRTDAQGRATVSFALPDNLTTWRATAIGHTPDTKVGRAVDKVLVTKDFLVRLELPRFLTQHDQSQVVALVHNDTGTMQTATVRLEAGNLTVIGAAVQTVPMEPGKVGEIVWPVMAENYGQATLTVKAWTARESSGTQYTDGVETTLPIRPHGRENVVAYAGELTAANPETEVLRLDPNAIPGISHLTVRITPSIATALVGATDYLVGFPYGCTEQTMSRFLPDLLVQRALRMNGISDVKRAEALPRMVRDGLLRLYRFQHPQTGGWGWWEHDSDDTWMTAYVLYGLANARAEGYPVSDKVLESGRKAAVKMAGDVNTDLNDRAFLIYALALIGDKDDARAQRDIKIAPRRLNSESIAYMVLTDRLLGRTMSDLQPELDRRTVSADTMLHWRANDKTDDAVWNWDDQEATATGVRALLAVNRSDPRIGSALRWLMAQRTGEYWSSTRDTSWVLAALCDYMTAQPSFSSGGAVTVKLNGAPLQTYALTPDLLHEPDLTLRVPASQLRPDKNDVTLERTGGSSPVFYSVELRETIAMEDIPALTGKLPNLGIKREYLRVLPQKIGDASWTLQTEPTNNQLRQGDRIRVRLTITAPRDMAYVLIEDPFPAGCEVNERGDAEEIEDWGFWWSGVDVRDDRIAFFVRDLSKGEHVIEYNLRAQTPGSYRTLPTLLQAMYAPETRAESAEARINLTR